MQPDFGVTAHDYALHRAGFPDSFFERLAAHGVGKPGQRVVDLGTGTGTLARGFARRGCRTIGIDASERMLEEARALDIEAGVRVEYRMAHAEETELADGSADVASAGQCWHWFDRPRATAEVIRILREDGRLVIAHFDWVAAPGSAAQATEALVETFNPKWKERRGPSLQARWPQELRDAGFRDVETFSYDEDVLYTPESWRGRVRASAGVGARLSEEKTRVFDEELARVLVAKYPGETLAIPHRLFAVIARRPD